MKVGRYWRTIRHLRREQILGQLLVRASRYWERPPQQVAHPPSDTFFNLGDSRVASMQGLWAPTPPQSSEQLLKNRFRFVGVERDFGNSIDWESQDSPLLWRYQLHYFDWMWSLNPNHDEERQFGLHALKSWLQHAAQASTTVTWAPYPCSLRLMNWSLLFHGAWREAILEDAALRESIRLSCWQQAKWLERHLEYHLLANHLLENAVALMVVGVLWNGSDADHWRRIATSLLERELAEQFLSDGMHYERSPMYHLRCCWLLDVLLSLAPSMIRELESIHARAFQALEWLLHPDREIALLNDSAMEAYAVPPQLLERLNLREGCWSLPESGYFVARWNGQYCIVDAGAIGPDYQPGHAHADYLTLEWSIAGKRFLTDTGILSYEVGPARAFDRSTRAHNTVTWNDEDSCEVWGGFRVGRRCRPVVDDWQPHESSFSLKASHSGYPNRLLKRSVHAEPYQLNVEDSVEGEVRGEFCSRWHLDPGWTCKQTSDGVVCSHEDHSVRVVTFGEGLLQIASSRYSPRFGTSLSRPVLEYRIVNPGKPWRIRFQVDETT